MQWEAIIWRPFKLFKQWSFFSRLRRWRLGHATANCFKCPEWTEKVYTKLNSEIVDYLVQFCTDNVTDDTQTKFKPSTMKEKLKRIVLAIRYIIRNIESQQLYDKGKRLIDELEEWCSGLRNAVSVQRQERAIVVRQMMHKIQDPNEFFRRPYGMLIILYLH